MSFRAKMILAAFNIGTGARLGVALVKLGRKGVSQLPVVSRRDTSRLLGIITMNDIARALFREDEKAEATVDVDDA